MVKTEKSVFVRAPVEKVFGYLRDPLTNPEWLPGMQEVKDVSGEGVGSTFRWVYKMAGVSFEGQSTVLEFVENERFVTESKGGIASTWTWDFCPEGDGTRIDTAVEYTVPVPVLGRLAESVIVRQNDGNLDRGLQNIKAVVESTS
jgi:carbon monoxide dehydrogenase subunit G